MDDLEKTRLQLDTGAAGLVEIVEVDHIPPCPRCGKPLNRLLKNMSRGLIQRDVIYSCGECGGFVGVGYSYSS